MSTLTADFHWHEQGIGSSEPTTVKAQERRGYGVLTFGPADGPGELAVYLPNAAAAYALASAVLTLGEKLEKQEQATKPDPERPWVDVPLPLDTDTAGTPGAEDSTTCLLGHADECAKVGCADERCPSF